jgi:uncharacterized membrane protein
MFWNWPRLGRKEQIMNLYSLVLFTHIVATLGLFAGLAIEWLILLALKKAGAAETQPWIGVWPKMLPLTIASAVLLIASGIYLAARVAVWNQGWIQVSLLSLLIIAPLGALAGRRVQAIASNRDAAGAPAQIAVLMSCRTTVALAVVMLMTIKPNLTESGAITAIALAAGWLIGRITAGHRAIKSVAIPQASE